MLLIAYKDAQQNIRNCIFVPCISFQITFFFKNDKDKRWKTKLYDRRDDPTFPLVNYPFINSNIPASPAYWIYISQLIRYSRACALYSDFLDRPHLLTQKLLKQGYVALSLNSSLQIIIQRHLNLLDFYHCQDFFQT
jgi:hypothetical protein